MKTFLNLTLLAILSSVLPSCSKTGKNPFPESKDGKYVIISDLHLGDSRALKGGYAQNITNRDTLKRFLEWLNSDEDWDELVILGDMFEEWAYPSDIPTLADEDGNVLTECEFVGKIIAANREIFDMMYTLRKKGKRLIYLPGNHDMQTTREDLETNLPGLFDIKTSIAGLGEYVPDENIYMEHGHRYDLMNAPYTGKGGIDDIPEGSILPPFFFIAKLLEGKSAKYIPSMPTKSYNEENPYDLVWSGISMAYGTDSILTITDGMTKKYGFYDYAYSTAKLFKDIQTRENWEKRCCENGAFMTPDALTSITFTLSRARCTNMVHDILSCSSMNSRILIWGHTHTPDLTAFEDEAKARMVYLNVGCWIDSRKKEKSNTCTFGTVQCYDGLYSVSLCRFDIGDDGNDIVTTIQTVDL